MNLCANRNVQKILRIVFMLIFSLASMSAATSNSDNSALVQLFEIYKPKTQVLCDSAQLWSLGKTIVDESDILPAKSCFGIQIKIAKSTIPFVISQSSDSAPTTMLSPSCDAFDARSIDGKNGNLYIPSWENNLGALRLDPGTGIETFYLIVTPTSEIAKNFSEKIIGIADACGFSPTSTTFEPVEDIIRSFVMQFPSVQWQVRRVKHD